MVQMVLYIISEDKPVNSNLYEAEETTIKFSEKDKDGLLIDLDKYMPQ